MAKCAMRKDGNRGEPVCTIRAQHEIVCKRKLADLERALLEHRAEDVLHSESFVSQLDPVVRSGDCPRMRMRAAANDDGGHVRDSYLSGLKRIRLGFAPSSPRRFFLSASYSW